MGSDSIDVGVIPESMGSDSIDVGVIPASNLLSNVGNQNRGAVLAEPFPWTVNQGVTHVFVIIYIRL